MISTAVVSFSNGHGVVGEVDIAVVAWGLSIVWIWVDGKMEGLESLQKSAE